jgi:hypothetical protein
LIFFAYFDYSVGDVQIRPDGSSSVSAPYINPSIAGFFDPLLAPFFDPVKLIVFCMRLKCMLSETRKSGLV